MKAAEKEFKKMSTGQVHEIDLEKCKPMMKNIAKSVGVQKARVGGDFAIAQAVTSQDHRECIRTILPDVIFIILSLTKESQKKRILDRHGDQAETIGLMMAQMFDLYEKPGEGEKNTYNVDITEGMTPKDVLDKVLEVVNKNCE